MEAGGQRGVWTTYFDKALCATAPGSASEFVASLGQLGTLDGAVNDDGLHSLCDGVRA